MSLPPPLRVARRVALVVAGGTTALAAWVLTAPSPARLLTTPPSPAVVVVDRHGVMLRLTVDPLGERRQDVDPGAVPATLAGAVLAAEDRRFFLHPGVDPVAVVRAAWADLRAGRVVSGASTVTMQLARLLEPRPRGWGAKLAQVRLALRLELALSKQEILAAYLSRAPLGNRVVGFAAGALVYLGKPAEQLSPAEAALLAAVPRAPSATNPWRNGAGLRARRDAILVRMARAGAIDAAALAAARAEPVVLAEEPFRTVAPHFLARMQEETAPLPPAAATIVTTLDVNLQRRVEVIVRRYLAELEEHGVRHMAVAVLDVPRREWLALEGSGGFFDRPAGQLDGTRTARQPGSALKPFTYAAAFDRGFSPATVVPDLEAAFTWAGGTWAPRNYDGRFHGPLRARQALACSVNVPAARILAAVGPEALLEELRRAGITTLASNPAVYGLGLTLGAGEVRLDELTGAYAALLSRGEWRPATAWRAVLGRDGRPLARPAAAAPRRVCSPEAAAQVVDVLADPEARAPAFGAWSVLRLPFPAAVKTGTSEGFRDNWCVGGTREVVVGVWCGSFDRAPMGNVSGVSGAGPVWREVMMAWAELAHPGEDLAEASTLPAPPAALRRVRVCALSGMAPGPACPVTAEELVRAGEAPAAPCTWHARDASGAVHVHWPPLYRTWAAAQRPPGDETVTATGRARAEPRLDPGGGAAVAVLSPVRGDAFVISPELPRRFQTLELTCSVAGSPRVVEWVVDGHAVASVEAPYRTAWTLQPGPHVIEARAGALRSAPVAITVYGR